MKKLFTFLLLTLLLAACGPTQSSALQASGQIEATEVAIAPEISGQVAEVSVAEGDSVIAGDPILRIEDKLLTAQRDAAAASVATAKSAYQAAEAAYASAQTQYQITLAAARAQDSSTRTANWIGKRPNPFDQPKWYFTRAENSAAAQAVIDTAQGNLEAAQANLDKVINDLNNADFLAAEKRLADARITYELTKAVYDRAKLSKEVTSPAQLTYPDIPLNFQGSYQSRIAIAKDLAEDPNLVHAAQRAYDEAKAELQAAQIAYGGLLTSDAATQVLNARAEVEVAQEQLASARDYQTSLQIGEDSLDVTAANDAVNQAKADMDQANARITEAEAQLAVLDLQIDKLTVKAPVDGVVLTRSVQPGEVLQAGMTALTIAKLDKLKVTVYIPEDRYGEVKLGDTASLSADSFPGQTFTATVTRIADQAEYTPRNVQTQEERQTTVYAIELSVDNPDGKLKPGMPVDVTFEQ